MPKPFSNPQDDEDLENVFEENPTDLNDSATDLKLRRACKSIDSLSIVDR